MVHENCCTLRSDTWKLLHSQQWYMKIVARLRVQQFSCTTGGSALIMALFLQSSLIFNSPFVLLELFSYYLYSLLYLLFFPFILYHYRSQVYLPLSPCPRCYRFCRSSESDSDKQRKSHASSTRRASPWVVMWKRRESFSTVFSSHGLSCSTLSYISFVFVLLIYASFTFLF